MPPTDRCGPQPHNSERGKISRLPTSYLLLPTSYDYYDDDDDHYYYYYYYYYLL